MKIIFNTQVNLLLLLLVATNTHATNWVALGESDAIKLFADMDSVKSEIGFKTISTYRNLFKHPNPNYKSIENEFAIFCAENAFIEYAPIIYSEMNRVNPIAKGTSTQEKKTISNLNSVPGLLAQQICKDSPQQSTTTAANTSTVRSQYKYVNQLNQNQIRELIKKSFENNELFDNFLWNLSFIYRINASMQPRKEYNDYLNNPGRVAFSDQKNAIQNDLQMMLNLLNEIANTLQIKVESVQLACGIKFEELALAENGFNTISSARLQADHYWFRHAEIKSTGTSSRAMNEFYMSKNPHELFRNWYPTYINQIRSIVLPNLSKLSNEYELEQENIALDNAKKAQWLKTAEGKQFTAKEEAEKNRAIKLRESEIQKKYASKDSIIDMRNKSSIAGSCFALMQISQNFGTAYDKSSKWSSIDGLRFTEGYGRAAQAYSEAPAAKIQEAMNFCMVAFR